MGKVATCHRQVADYRPVAVPGIFLAGDAASSAADRGHSLSSLHPPLAAVASLPMVGMTVSVAVAVEESLKK